MENSQTTFRKFAARGGRSPLSPPYGSAPAQSDLSAACEIRHRGIQQHRPEVKYLQSRAHRRRKRQAERCDDVTRNLITLMASGDTGTDERGKRRRNCPHTMLPTIPHTHDSPSLPAFIKVNRSSTYPFQFLRQFRPHPTFLTVAS